MSYPSALSRLCLACRSQLEISVPTSSSVTCANARQVVSESIKTLIFSLQIFSLLWFCADGVRHILGPKESESKCDKPNSWSSKNKDYKKSAMVTENATKVMDIRHFI